MRVKYEVRVREQVSPGKWMKKSRFYEAGSPGEASAHYDGPGRVMWVTKVSKEKLLGVGEFFKLGDKLLRELQDEDLQMREHRQEESRRRQHREGNLKEKETF